MFWRDLVGPRARRWATAATVILGMMFASVGAEAMRVSPMVVEMTTTGAASAARIEVGNVGSAALPYETTITRLEITEDGEMVETPAEENFLVFPPQGVVGVGGRQVVRVQWVGEPNLDTSQAYYLWVRQLPVPTDGQPQPGGEVNVTVLYTMKALLIIAPPGSEPKIDVVSTKPVMIEPRVAEGQAPPDAKPEPGVEVVVVNTGKRYALMSGATWAVEGTTADGQPFSRTYNTGELSAAMGVGYVPPGGVRRTFKVPTGGIQLDPSKPITVRFSR